MEVAVVERAVIRVTGTDAATYLQGQLSQDIASLAPGDSVLSYLLEPNGKVVALLRVRRADDEQFEMIVDEPAGDAVVARLRRYLLRTKAEVADPTVEPCQVVFGADPLPSALASLWPDPTVAQDLVGIDPAGREGADDIGEIAYERRRIAAGVPVSGVDIGSDTIPAEVGAWAIERGVSFTKGCYTGQELVARIDSRGANVPRPLRGVVAADGEALSANAEVVVDGKTVGRLTSTAGPLGMGPVSRTVVPPAAATVEGRPVEVRAFPLET